MVAKGVRKSWEMELSSEFRQAFRFHLQLR